MVTKFRYLGDTIVATPFLRQLKETAPLAEITLLAGPQIPALLAGCPYVRDVRVFDPDEGRTNRLISDLRGERFDAAFLLNRSLHSAYVAFAGRIPHRIGFNTESRGPLLTVRAPYSRTRPEIDCYLDLLRAVGVDARYALPELWVTADERASARGILSQAGVSPGKTKVLIQPGAKDAYKKQWQPSRFARVIDMLGEALPEAAFAVIGAKDEAAACDAVVAQSSPRVANLAGGTGLREILALLAEADLLIANDTAIVHAAAALKTSTVTVQGPLTAAKWSYGPPCHQVITAPGGDGTDRHANRRALDSIEPAPVAEAALQLLAHVEAST